MIKHRRALKAKTVCLGDRGVLPGEPKKVVQEVCGVKKFA